MAQDQDQASAAAPAPETARPEAAGVDAAKAPAAEVPAIAPIRPYVLAVDESRLQMRSYEQAFTGTKELKRFDVAGCANPAAAIEKLSRLRAKEAKPSLILLEWKKPYAVAQDFLDTLRRDVRWAKIPVILVAASAVDGAAADSALRNGANDSVLKPIKLNLLAEKINRYSPPA